MADSLFFQLINWFSPSETKALQQVENKPLEAKHGATFAQPYGIKPTYSPEEAMSAYAGHGYTYAAVSRASQDLAALPLRLLKGKERTLVEEHPFIDLLASPSSGADGFLFREQLVTDLILTGNCFILLLGQTDIPTSIIRLHPQNVKLQTDQTGVSGYIYDSGGQRVIYPPDRVVHGRLASWSNGPAQLLGTGAIEPLNRELHADINSQNLVSDASAKARPDLLISPSDPADIWGPEMRREIASEYKKLSANGGAMVLSGLANVEPLQLSPREMEYTRAREMARESISAVTGVPPTVLGLPSANYALSRQQARNYWSVQTKRGKRLALLFSQIAKRFDPDLDIEHDYSGVEALQEARTEQLHRVQMHILNGVSARDAYKYEGLDFPSDIQGAEADNVDETTEDVRSKTEVLARFLSGEIVNRKEDDLSTREKKNKAVGDEDPTNFPADGNDQKVSLKNSNFQVFDYEYAQDLKDNWPKIWGAGGNIEGNNQFRRLTPVVRRESQEPTTDTEEGAIRKREAWAARHLQDGAQFDEEDPPSPNISSVAGIVAQVKWFVVGALGQARMKEILDEVKAKQTKERARTHLWQMYMKAYNEPAEKELFRATKSYFRGAIIRYRKRVKENVTPSLTKGVNDLRSLLAEDEEVRIASVQIGGKWKKWYKKTGDEQLQMMLRAGGLSTAAATAAVATGATDQYVAVFARQMVRTRVGAVGKLVSDGLLQGLTIDKIAANISTLSGFNDKAAMLVARTEAGRTTNLGTQQAFTDAAGFGIKLRKQWLSARDDTVRDSHAELDGAVVGTSELFVTREGASGEAPGSMDEPSENYNCRCTMIAVVDEDAPVGGWNKPKK
jgi:HK97 family phage portal protein